MFRDLLGGLKKEAEKRLAEQEEQKQRNEQQKTQEPAKQPTPQPKPRKHNYGRLAAWIKTNYGANFRDGQTNDEVKTQLDQIFNKLETSGRLSGDAKRGFRKYIDNRSYGDLVKVLE
jgi:hypothetical protein